MRSSPYSFLLLLSYVRYLIKIPKAVGVFRQRNSKEFKFYVDALIGFVSLKYERLNSIASQYSSRNIPKNHLWRVPFLGNMPFRVWKERANKKVTKSKILENSWMSGYLSFTINWSTLSNDTYHPNRRISS